MQTVSVHQAKDRFSSLLQAVEAGEEVVITRHGRAVAQIAPPPPARRKPVLGGTKGRIQLLPCWDDPITEEELLGEGN